MSTLLATTERAKESAESAKESADIAEESAKNAKESADIAEESAKNAVDTATTALNRKNYDYIRRDLRFENQIISVIPNAVMYIYNSAESVDFDTVHLALVDSDNPIDDLAEEYVLILDFTNMTSIPEIILDEYIKWLDGEPPVIEAGKVYMFSFVKVREETYSTLFYLGIGGEFN